MFNATITSQTGRWCFCECISLNKKTHCEVIVIISGQFNSISLTSHSAEIEILLLPCQRFTIKRISDKSKPISLGNHSAKTIHHKKQKNCMNKLTQVLSEILIVKII